MAVDPIVAVGLLTQVEVDQLGLSLDRLWPVDETPCFAALLAAIDDAERAAACDPRNKELPPA